MDKITKPQNKRIITSEKLLAAYSLMTEQSIPALRSYPADISYHDLTYFLAEKEEEIEVLEKRSLIYLFRSTGTSVLVLDVALEKPETLVNYFSLNDVAFLIDVETLCLWKIKKEKFILDFKNKEGKSLTESNFREEYIDNLSLKAKCEICLRDVTFYGDYVDYESPVGRVSKYRCHNHRNLYC